ncbi:MAG: AAA family ATPase [Acidobacteriaceae bacterium]
MVNDFYGLREDPFGATPDSRYLFESATHREALASLLYGVEAGRGFMALIAKPGMGKTTLLFRGLAHLREKGRTVFLFQTIQTPLDLLRTLLADLGVHDLQGGLFELQTKLNEILVEFFNRGERLVIVIDETQNLDDSVLEMVRMLSNFETQQQKLMQIVLSGQPQLAQKLAAPNLIQLRQRIAIVAHLQAFSAEETENYVEHRLGVAGYSSARPLFTRSALQLIAQHSEGIPRNINTLCFNALSIGCALKQKTIDADIVREVISDLDLAPLGQLPAVSAVAFIEKPAVAPTVRRVPRFTGWALKGALATTLLLVLTAVPMMPSRPQATVLADARDSARLTVAPIIAAARPETHEGPRPSHPTAALPAPDPGPGKLQIDAQERILVPPGVTLYEICRETMKGCTPREMAAIRRLNPWLTNPNHLESGRRLQMPSVGQSAAEAASSSYSALSAKGVPK